MSKPIEVGLTREELIEALGRLVEIPRKEAHLIVETICGSIVRALRTGDKIELRGFGSFHTRQRRARIGRNPKTGVHVQVPAKRIPFFKPSKELTALLNRPAPEAPSGSEKSVG